ncbi:MAG: hypothetical protein ABL899_02000 [Nitrospira sp.]
MTLLEEFELYKSSRLSDDDPKKLAFAFATNFLIRQGFGDVWDKAGAKTKESCLEDWLKLAESFMPLPPVPVRRTRVQKKKVASETSEE